MSMSIPKKASSSSSSPSMAASSGISSSSRSNSSSSMPTGGMWLMALSHVAIMSVAFWCGSEYGLRFGDGLLLSTNLECGHGDARSSSTSSSSSILSPPPPRSSNNNAAEQQQQQQRPVDDENVAPWVLPKEVGDFVAGVARVNRDDFLKTFDDGLPMEESTPGNQDVLILYDSKGSLPENWNENLQYYSSATEATSQCRYMRVISVDPEREDPVCLAIQGNNAEPHYYIHKWLQQPDGSYQATSRYQPLDPKETSVMINPPEPSQVQAANRMLQRYLSNYEDISASIKTLVKNAAAQDPKKQKNVVITVCNKARLDFLRNFVCAARQRKVLPPNLIVFSMDEETHRVASSSSDLGLTSVYHPQLFSYTKDIVKDLDERVQVDLAKIFATYLISDLGYHMLYHDVTVVPYQDYYQHMVSTVVDKYNTHQTTPGGSFELFFSYDFTTDPMYAPWGANSGFFYAINTEKTRYFFSLLLRRAALILSTQSHQATVSVVLSDVSNHYGLRVKVLSKEGHDFPVGYHCHHDWKFMKDMMQGTVQPYVFHMNWDEDSHQMKQQHLEQMGAWYVENNNKCVAGGPPKPVCHYRNMPSKIPCPDAPMAKFRTEQESFW